MSQNDAPDMIWIDPKDSTFWNDSGDVKSLVAYRRVDLAPPDAAQEAAERTVHAILTIYADRFSLSRAQHKQALTQIILSEFATTPDAVRQARRETWEAAARLVDAQEPPDYEHGTSENGWNDAITHCATALRAEGEKGEGNG